MAMTLKADTAAIGPLVGGLGLSPERVPQRCTDGARLGEERLEGHADTPGNNPRRYDPTASTRPAMISEGVLVTSLPAVGTGPADHHRGGRSPCSLLCRHRPLGGRGGGRGRGCGRAYG